MRIAVIGYGSVGSSLGRRFEEQGHEVVFGVRDTRSEKVEAFVSQAGRPVRVAPVPEAAAGAEVVVLATPYSAAADALRACGDLGARVVVDCTNPIGPGLTLAVGPNTSGSETLAAAAQGERFVKAFNTYGYENFVDTYYGGKGPVRPAMFVAGDDAEAKAVVAGLAQGMGFQPVDTGGLAMARYLEPLALLWINMARVQHKGPGFTWAMLER